MGIIYAMFPQLRYILWTSILALGLTSCGSLFGTPATPTLELPTATSVPPTPTPPPLAAIVNGEWITEAEFQAELGRYLEAQRTLEKELSPDEGAQVVLDDLIAQVLLSQAARENGFEITEADLQSRIEALADQAGGQDKLSQWLADHGYTSESFNSALKRAAEAAWMRDKIISDVPETAEQVHARQILLYNEETARKVAERLATGVAFEELAVIYDPVTGGDLGWFPRGYLLTPGIEEAAFALQPGQHSDLIVTEVGYHFVMVVDRDLQHLLSPDAFRAMQAKALQDWLSQKRASGDIVLDP